MPPHRLINFEIQKYYQNYPKFNGVYSRNNLPKIKDGTYVINLDEYKSIRTNWIAFYVNVNNTRASYDAIYLDKFGVHSVMCIYFCTGFIDFMLKGKSLFD